MKITINPSTGELTCDFDANSRMEVQQAINIARQIHDGKKVDAAARTLLVFSDEDDEIPAEDLIVPAPTTVTEDERIASRLQTREQLETWMYLRRNDRMRGVALAGVAHRFKLSSTAASARCATLVKAGYAVRVGKGYYRAVVPSED